MAGRVLWAGLHLLDRQLVDRHGALCGNVDDLELTEPDAEGRVFVDAIICGPGVLLGRLGMSRLGRWLERAIVPVDAGRTARVDASLVMDIGSHVSLAVESDELATAATEQWFRDHLIAHIPGSRDAGR